MVKTDSFSVGAVAAAEIYLGPGQKVASNGQDQVSPEYLPAQILPQWTMEAPEVLLGVKVKPACKAEVEEAVVEKDLLVQLGVVAVAKASLDCLDA